MGAFIYRDANGTGTNSFSNIQLRWNYGNNGLTDAAIVDIRVFAIEMVYVSEGSFSIGSGGNEYSAFYEYPILSNPFRITSESSITIGTTDGNLYYNFSEDGGDQQGPIPEEFPKGYNDFYCMKYEISQKQYCDFLNILTQVQADTRKFTIVDSSRYAIKGSTVGNYSTSNPYVACNFLSWADLAAYLDWSGLRPMTELEFEKACRGPIDPVINEYAWGSTSYIQNLGLNYPGTFNESSINSANCNFRTNIYIPEGPVRVGCFATESSDRFKSGSTYYGIMEMSGNVWERTITVGNVNGRSFLGTHGDGLLNINGELTNIDWPDRFANGSNSKGGSWHAATLIYYMVSDRRLGSNTNRRRSLIVGGCGVRTAP